MVLSPFVGPQDNQQAYQTQYKFQCFNIHGTNQAEQVRGRHDVLDGDSIPWCLEAPWISKFRFYSKTSYAMLNIVEFCGAHLSQYQRPTKHLQTSTERLGIPNVVSLKRCKNGMKMVKILHMTIRSWDGVSWKTNPKMP